MRINLPKSLEDVQANSFEPVPPGTYTLEVQTVENKISAQQKPYLNIKFKIVDDPEFANKIIFDKVSLAEEALWRLKQLSEATGFEITDEFDTEELQGLTCEVVVVIEKGKPRDPSNPDDCYPDQNKIKEYKK